MSAPSPLPNSLPKLPFGLKFAYGVGQTAEGLKNGALGMFLIFYYNQVLGLPGTLAGLAVGIALLIDALVDPLVGSASDHWRSRHGRRHPFIFGSILPLALLFYLLFAPPVTGDGPLFAWLLAFAVLARTAMSFYQVPFLALGAELTNDFLERSSVVGFRMTFAMLGTLLAMFVGFQVYFVPSEGYANGQLNPAAYPPFAATLSVLMAATIFYSAWVTRRMIPLLPVATPGAPVGPFRFLVRVLVDLWAVLRSGSFRWLFVGVLTVFVMIGTQTALDLYMYTYFWELQRSEILALAAAYPFGLMLGAMLAPRLHFMRGKRWALLFGTVWWAGLQVLPVSLRLFDLFPENGSALLVPILVVLRAIQAAGAVQANVSFGSMIADCIDEHELNTGQRDAGIFFAASSFAGQAATGLGGLIAGLALDLIAWPTGASIRTAADVPPEALTSLGVLYGPVIGCCSILTYWCYSHYRLTRERHAEILAALARRRQAEESFVTEPAPASPDAPRLATRVPDPG